MSAVTSANLMGITGIARRLVLDGALDEAAARKAMDAATAEKQPLAAYLSERRLVTPAALAAANSIEFGMPLVDALALDASQSAIALVKEELLRKHQVLPLFKRGSRLFVGTSDPTDHQALDELKFHTNLAVEPILVDADRIKRCLDQWLEVAEAMADEMADSEGLEGLEVGGGDDDLSNDTGVDAKGEDTPVVKFINKVAGGRDPQGRQRHPLRTLRNRIPGALPHRRHPQDRQAGSGEAARAHCRAPEGDVAAGHRRARVPQDGRIKLNLSKTKQIDFRVSTCPPCSARRSCCVSWTAARPSSASTSWATKPTSRTVLDAIQKPYGMVLVTGPTGSGKTCRCTPRWASSTTRRATSARSKTRWKSASPASTRCSRTSSAA
jgi:type IV pilus assembly protein PilB